MTRAAGGVVDVAFEGDTLVISPRGWWTMLSLRRRLRIPRSAILSARVSKDPTLDVPVRIRVGGTATPMLRAGFMRGGGRRSWWCYRYGRPAVVVDLRPPTLSALVMLTDDDEATARSIDEWIRVRRG